MSALPTGIADRIHATSCCWLWTGGRTSRGYGAAYWQGRQSLAHRLVRHLLVGDIAVWTTDFTLDQLDHLCRNPLCVNPAHLEPVTGRENNLRSGSITARNAVKTHCVRGHPFDTTNTLERGDGTGRECRACRRIRQGQGRRLKAAAS